MASPQSNCRFGATPDVRRSIASGSRSLDEVISSIRDLSPRFSMSWALSSELLKIDMNSATLSEGILNLSTERS
jgi:hypothetical protein